MPKVHEMLSYYVKDQAMAEDGVIHSVGGRGAEGSGQVQAVGDRNTPWVTNYKKKLMNA